jgi:AraC-like DNA-binding protein
MNKYPWEIGTRLAFQVQAREFDSAQQSVSHLFERICGNHGCSNFDELKLRMMQVLTIASRAAYNAGGNSDTLFRLNLTFIKAILRVKTREDLLPLVQEMLRRIISIIPERNMADADRINKALAYIRDNCTKKISRAHVAETLCCSQSHLSQLFSEATGHTFKEFVLKYRMEKAKELLRNYDFNVTDVAYEIGYDDPNYFCSAFKRVVGIPPSAYRKKISKNP